jgi:hypothetical protein
MKMKGLQLLWQTEFMSVYVSPVFTCKGGARHEGPVVALWHTEFVSVYAHCTGAERGDYAVGAADEGAGDGGTVCRPQCQ